MKRLCINCSEPLDEGKRSHAKFCTIQCKKNAEHKRRIADKDRRETNRLRAKAWREANKDRAKAKVSEWQRQNRARCTAIGMRYIASKKSATPNWLDKKMEQDIQDIYWLADDVRKISPDNYHVDHVIPLQGQGVCGLHVPWNLQVLPSDINISKGNRTND